MVVVLPVKLENDWFTVWIIKEMIRLYVHIKEKNYIYLIAAESY